MWLVSIVSVAILVVLCAVGTFHAVYDDNLWQRIGMGCIAVGYGSALIGGDDYQALAHVGEACFAIGVAWKVWKHRRPPPAPKVHNFPWAG